MNQTHLKFICTELELGNPEGDVTSVLDGDLDQLNILWNKEDQPILIDWESVRKLNPTREIIRAALAWSGVVRDNASLPIFTHILRTYINSGRRLNIKHINAALYSMVGSAVNWILFNTKLACASDLP